MGLGGNGEGGGDDRNEFGEVDTKILSLGPKIEKAKRQKKDRQREESEKVSQFDRQLMMSHFINDTDNNPAGFSPSKRFVILTPDGVERLIYRITPEGEFELSGEKAVNAMVASHMETDFAGNPLMEMCNSQRKQAVEYWYYSTPAVEPPKKIAWKGEDCLAFRKLPFELGLGDTPLFDEMMARTSNAEALMCFIGSLVFEEADRQQYVWLHGQGGEGKGALCRFLAKALGRLYASRQAPEKANQFWTYSIRDARLVVFPDCNNTGFVASGLFKSLTGGDHVNMERKNGLQWSEVISAKFMFLSNEKPNLSSEMADRRRIIYCEIKPFNGDQDPRYEAQLWKEGGYFLSKCASLYSGMYPHHGVIKTETDVIATWIATNEEDMEEFFNNHFELDKNSYCKPKDFQDKIQMFSRKKHEQRMFRSWLERTHKIVKKPQYHDGNTIYSYHGIKAKIWVAQY